MYRGVMKASQHLNTIPPAEILPGVFLRVFGVTAVTKKNKNETEYRFT